MVVESRRQKAPLCLADSNGQSPLLHLVEDAHVKKHIVHFHSSYGRTRDFKCAYSFKKNKKNRDGK